MRFQKLLLALIFGLFFNLLFSQQAANLWEGHFSYLDIKDVSIAPNIIFVASENAIFSYDLQTNEINEISSVDGLSGDLISTIYYSESNDLILVGYDTGLIEVVKNATTSPEVFSVIDILEKQTISPNVKKVNHFHEDNGLIYISTDYGISVYDIANLEFGDTYFIGVNGSQIQVNQLTVFEGNIYAACQNDAIKMASLSNPNLIDWQEWGTIGNSGYTFIENSGNKLYAINTSNTIVGINNNVLTGLTTFPAQVRDMRSFAGLLTVTTKSNVYLYNSNFNPLDVINTTEDVDVDFSLAVAADENDIFIGTTGIVATGKSGKGLLRTNLAVTGGFQEIHPDGPLYNNMFSIETVADELWAVFGGYSQTFNFTGGVARAGVSHLKGEVWSNISYDSISDVIPNPFYLSHIAINPFDPSQVFISSHYSGLIEFNDEVPTILYNQDNSTLVPFAGDFKLTTVSAFDREGKLYVMNGRTSAPLNEFNNGNWQSFDFTSIIPPDPPGLNLGFSSMVIDNQNQIFIGSVEFGLIGFRKNGGSFEVVFANSEEDNFPSKFVKSLALDNNGQLWIGTDSGIRVLFGPSAFFEVDTEVNNIVILDNGIPAELLELQSITDIEVDGSNNKWVGTADSGCFYFSPDGQETIYQFTKDNSPLPSNNINDIAIDPVSGEVYFATDRGLVSFASGGTKPQETLEDAYVYPNPVRPEYDILGYDDLNNINNGIKVSGLTENVNIKITDIEGNLVAEAQSQINKRSSRANYNFAIDGGTGIWNGKNLRGNIVATGVYLILISDLDSFETKVLKVLIVR